MYRILFLLIFLLFPMSAFAWEARVVTVSDGDTITVEPIQGGDRVKIRLHGIDAPERKQPHGEVSRGLAFDIALYKTVDVEELSRDRYKRTVAIITLPDGETFQAAMLRAGLAWVYPRYCKDCSYWEALQEEAQREQRGLWVDDSPVPPWEWRKGQR